MQEATVSREHDHEHGDGPMHGGPADDGHEHIHLPSPSIWPLVLAVGMLITGYGIIYITDPGVPVSPIIIAAGVVVVLVALRGWIGDMIRERQQQHG